MCLRKSTLKCKGVLDFDTWSLPLPLTPLRRTHALTRWNVPSWTVQGCTLMFLTRIAVIHSAWRMSATKWRIILVKKRYYQLTCLPRKTKFWDWHYTHRLAKFFSFYLHQNNTNVQLKYISQENSSHIPPNSPSGCPWEFMGTRFRVTLGIFCGYVFCSFWDVPRSS